MEKIYKLIDPFTEEPRYIGYTCMPLIDRLGAHLRGSLRKHRTHKECWIVSLLERGKSPSIELVKSISPLDGPWKYWEQYYIKLYRELGYNLTNSTDGGEGNNHQIFTQETRDKMGKSHRGKTPSPETRDKISKALLGRTGILSPASKPIIAYNEIEELFFACAEDAARYFRDWGMRVSAQNIRQCLRGDRYCSGKYVRSNVLGYKFKRA